MTRETGVAHSTHHTDSLSLSEKAEFCILYIIVKMLIISNSALVEISARHSYEDLGRSF
jgi:hypothetical protein